MTDNLRHTGVGYARANQEVLPVTMPPFRIAFVAALAVTLFTFVPVAPAAPGGGGGGQKGSCVRKAPGIGVDNTWAWAAPGSWGLSGQQLRYSIDVLNNDVGCGSSSFTVSVTSPSGFLISVPMNSVTLQSSSLADLSAYVTSPPALADGDYPVTVMVQRAGESSPAAAYTSYYKLYASDATAPRLYLPNPWDGDTISGRSYNFTVSSADDHAVQKIDMYIDGSYTTTKLCDGISYECQLYYNRSLRGLLGPHTATFKSTDWMGNVGVLMVHFTAS